MLWSVSRLRLCFAWDEENALWSSALLNTDFFDEIKNIEKQVDYNNFMMLMNKMFWLVLQLFSLIDMETPRCFRKLLCHPWTYDIIVLICLLSCRLKPSQQSLSHSNIYYLQRWIILILIFHMDLNNFQIRNKIKRSYYKLKFLMVELFKIVP